VRGKFAAAGVDDSLERKLYQRVSNEETWEYMAELLNGGRKSYRYL